MYSRYEQLKTERGVTDYQVARSTGIAASTLTAWKKGEYTPKVDKMKRIAEFFNVPLEELI